MVMGMFYTLDMPCCITPIFIQNLNAFLTIGNVPNCQFWFFTSVLSFESSCQVDQELNRNLIPKYNISRGMDTFRIKRNKKGKQHDISSNAIEGRNFVL